jgi:ribosome-associated protein
MAEEEERHDADLPIGRHRFIPRSELIWTFSSSGGPGGQHANTSNTRAELRFDLARSSAFPTAERDRLVDILGPVVRVSVADERSQWRNRQAARERLAAKLESALRRDPPRVATRPSRGSKERRLLAKRLRSITKSGRSTTRDDE